MESDIPKVFTADYYDYYYFADPKGKKFRRPNGSIDYWGYRNPQGFWEGCWPVAKAWKTIFNPRNLLDVGCGRACFVKAARDYGIEAYGFDFSKFAIENPMPGVKKEWLKLHDATKPWPYKDKSFDLIVMLDFWEHIYIDDIPKVIKEMYRVGRKWFFFEIATVGGGSGPGIHEKGYILRKGEPIPIELEANVVAGHVTVQPRSFWEDMFNEYGDVLIRRDLEEYFRALVPKEYLVNWHCIVVLEVL